MGKKRLFSNLWETSKMIWFTSDLHVYHTNIISYSKRPYKTVEEMNEALVNNWNSLVKPEDSVYCLGDFSMAFRPVETFSPRLIGIKYLVPGNHDFLHSYHKKSRNPENRAKWIQSYTDSGWIVLPEQTTLNLDGIGTVNLCHHPYSDERVDESDPEYQDKFAKWRPLDDGKILLHGHVHERFLTKRSSKNTLMINVGVDVFNYRPVSLDQLKELISCQNK